MREIRIENPSILKHYTTYLGADYSSGTSVTVLNNNSFAANDLLVFGEPREELTELKKLNSVSGSTTFTIASALNFAHGKGTPVYKTLWDNVSIEWRSSSAGTFAEITQSAIQWDNKEGETVYFHQTGDDNSEYRFRFYNSVTTTYSEYSPTLTGAGFTRAQVGYMIKQIRKTVNDEERKIVEDVEIIRFLNRAQDIVYAHNPRYWFLQIDTYQAGTGIAALASTKVYSLATYTTFGHLGRLRYNYSSGSVNQIYDLEKKDSTEFDRLTTDLNKGTDDWVARYKLLPADSSSANGYFQVDPAPTNSSVGTFYPVYYEKMANLDTVDDTTQIPIPEVLEDFAISQIEAIKGNETKAKTYLDLFLGPPDTQIRNVDITGIKLLDDIDKQQKDAVDQPKGFVFKGQKYHKETFGNPRINRDIIKELYE